MRTVVVFVVAVIIAFTLSMSVKLVYNHWGQKASQREGADAAVASPTPGIKVAVQEGLVIRSRNGTPAVTIKDDVVTVHTAIGTAVVPLYPAPSSTPQTEPKPFAFDMHYDNGDTCMGYIYATRELPLGDAGFVAPFKFIQREMDFAGAGYQYFFSSSPLFNCANVRRNVEATVMR